MTLTDPPPPSYYNQPCHLLFMAENLLINSRLWINLNVFLQQQRKGSDIVKYSIILYEGWIISPTSVQTRILYHIIYCSNFLFCNMPLLHGDYYIIFFYNYRLMPLNREIFEDFIILLCDFYHTKVIPPFWNYRFIIIFDCWFFKLIYFSYK